MGAAPDQKQDPFAAALQEQAAQAPQTEQPTQLSAEEAAKRQAQIDNLRKMFQQKVQEEVPTAQHSPEEEVPIRLDEMPVLSPAQVPIKGSGIDGIKNFFAQLQLGKVGEVVKKVVQAPGKIVKAIGQGIMGFWTAGDSRPLPGPPLKA